MMAKPVAFMASYRRFCNTKTKDLEDHVTDMKAKAELENCIWYDTEVLEFALAFINLHC